MVDQSRFDATTKTSAPLPIPKGSVSQLQPCHDLGSVFYLKRSWGTYTIEAYSLDTSTSSKKFSTLVPDFTPPQQGCSHSYGYGKLVWVDANRLHVGSITAPCQSLKNPHLVDIPYEGNLRDPIVLKAGKPDQPPSTSIAGTKVLLCQDHLDSTHLILCDLGSGQCHKLFEAPDIHAPTAYIHPDTNQLSVAWIQRPKSESKTSFKPASVMLLSLQVQDTEASIAPTAPVLIASSILAASARFSPTGDALGFVTEASDQACRFYRYDLRASSLQTFDLPHRSFDDPLHPRDQLWCFGASSFVIFIVHSQATRTRLLRIQLGEYSEQLDCPLTHIAALSRLVTTDHLIIVGSHPSAAPDIQLIKAKAVTPVRPRSPNHRTLINGQSPTYGLYYPSANPKATSRPLLVPIHAHPEQHVFAGFQPKAQYFNQLGYDVFFPNYRGSTGYGPRFRSSPSLSDLSIPAKDLLSGLKILAHETKRPMRHILWGGPSGGLIALQAALAEPNMIDLLILVFTPLEKIAVTIKGLQCPLLLFIGTDKDRFSPSLQKDIEGSLKSKAQICNIITINETGHNLSQCHNYQIYYDTICKFLEEF